MDLSNISFVIFCIILSHVLNSAIQVVEPQPVLLQALPVLVQASIFLFQSQLLPFQYQVEPVELLCLQKQPVEVQMKRTLILN